MHGHETTRAREYGTTRSGERFDARTIGEVWRKARPVAGKPPTEWRLDACGATIRLFDYGNTTSKHGWEIDHIEPVANGGSDDIANLQPLQWRNNRAKDNGPLRCVIVA
jgi:hypothetical protein